MSSERRTYSVSKSTSILLALLILSLLALNIALIIQNRKLKTLTQRTNDPGALKVGNVLPPLSGFDMDGKKLTVNYRADQRKAVLLVFSPRCKFCTENMPNWKAIVEGIDQNSYHVVAVSTVADGVRDYVSQHGLLHVPIIAEMDPASRTAYGINATPQTVLVDSQGRVEKVWTGLIERDQWQDVERSLGLSALALK